MKEYRDEELGALLSRLDEPPSSAPGFEARVWRRIDTAAASTPAVTSPAFGGRRRRPLLIAAATSVIVAAVVAVVVLFGLPGASRQTGPAPVSAAVVLARMAEAASSFHTLQATVTSRKGGYDNGGTFITDAAGDFSLRFAATKAAGPLVFIYNARRHVVIDTYLDSDGKRVSYRWDQSVPYEGIGVSGWSYENPPGYAWLVRAALADGDPRITVVNTVFDGRSAWKVSLPSTRYFGYLGGCSFVVDQQTGFLVHSTWPPDPDNPGSGGSFSLTNLRVDHPLPAGAFPISPPRGARLVSDERNRYYCTLEQVPARVGFRPLLPSYLPPGYRLSDVATDPRGPLDFAGWQGPDPGSHDPHREAFLRYRHGADSFTVHIYSIAHLPRVEVAELHRGLAGWPAYGNALLHSGAFAGCKAQTWFALNGANLLVVGKTYAAYISGSLTRGELYDVASSMRPS